MDTEYKSWDFRLDKNLSWGLRASPLSKRCTTHPEDGPGILHSLSGSEAYGRLDLTDKYPPSMTSVLDVCAPRVLYNTP
eukprot:968084-Pyramimonas_sp.AAC.1